MLNQTSERSREEREMVLWCKLCGAYIGLRAPLQDWRVERDSICARCVIRPEGLPDGPAKTISSVAEDAKQQVIGEA